MTPTPPSSAPSPVPAPPPPPVQDARPIAHSAPYRAGTVPAGPAPAAPTPATSIWRRGLARLAGGPGRLTGLDVARGLAVLGMFVAHLYTPDPLTGADPMSWSWVFDGRSSILFATLAGVSLAIMSGRTRPLEGVPALQARMRILVRALLIFTIGEVLTMLGTPVAIILQAYAVLFVLALPFLRWSARQLFVLAAVSALVMPFVTPLVASALAWAQLGYVPLTGLLVTGMYPGMIWFTFIVLGLAIGRCRLASTDVQLRLMAVGAAVSTLAYSCAAIVGGAPPLDPAGGGSMVAGAPDFVLPDVAAVARTAEAHSGGLAEVVGSGAFAMAVIGLCLLAAQGGRWLRALLTPLAAVGSMALTAYTVHIVALWRVGDAYWEQTGLQLLVPFVEITLIGCMLWRFFLGRGPLERLLTWVSWKAAGITPAAGGRTAT